MISFIQDMDVIKSRVFSLGGNECLYSVIKAWKSHTSKNGKIDKRTYKAFIVFKLE